MKKSELDSILKKARTPEPMEEFWEEFPGQVTRQLNRPPWEIATQRHWFPKFAWALATAFCVLIAFGLGHWRGQMETRATPDILANAKLVHETLAMFPNQVRAIVEDGHGLHLILSDGNNVPSSPLLYVHICDGKNCSSLVTFSGQEIQVADQKMTVLADTRGGIILTGDDFAWSSDQKTPDSHLKIEAKILSTTAL